MGMDRRVQFIVNSHPAVLDGFITMTRKAVLESERPSVLESLKKKNPQQAARPSSRRREEVR